MSFDSNEIARYPNKISLIIKFLINFVPITIGIVLIIELRFVVLCMFPKLNLPPAALKIVKKADSHSVWCTIRNSYLLLTPEEWVRQHCIHYLLNEKQYQRGRLASEFPLKIGNHTRRCDLLYFDSFGKPLLVIECKATTVPIDEKTFLQTSNYVASTGASFFWMTNGIDHVIVDCSNGLNYLTELPNLD